jgi:tetratricopeptide (TPR) repeat protein
MGQGRSRCSNGGDKVSVQSPISLKRPYRLAFVVLAAVAACYLAIQGWAWYHFHAGDIALAQFRSEAARVHLQQSLRVWPRSPIVHLMAARAERRCGDVDAAQQHLDQCRKYANADVTDAASFEWALLLAAAGELDTVEQSLQSRLLSRPGDAPLIWESLAEGYRRNYRMPEALRTLDTWLHFEPENAHVYYLRGEVHRQVGALNRAREEFRRVVELDPEHREARRHLASCLVQVGRYQEAAEHLDGLLRQTPHDPDLLTLKARSQYDLGERQEAIGLLEVALQHHPDDGPALRERARIALAAEQFVEAEQWYRRTLDVLPNNYEARWGLYQSLQSQEKTAEADAELAKAQQLKNSYERIHEIQTNEMTKRPTDPALQAELGEMLLRTGRSDSAEYWLLNALQLDPKLPEAHAALARLYDDQGRAAEAEQHRLAADSGPGE